MEAVRAGQVSCRVNTGCLNLARSKRQVHENLARGMRIWHGVKTGAYESQDICPYSITVLSTELLEYSGIVLQYHGSEY